MRQYLAEGLKGAVPFVADRDKIIVESLPNGKTRTRIPGRFSICDCINGNNRRYSKRVWEKNLQTGSRLMEAIEKNAAFGLLEHPKDGQVTLLSPISHVVTAAALKEGKDNSGGQLHEVIGEIQVLGTEEGKKLTALIEAGYNPLVSSRGFGSLVKSTDGVDEVQDDYVCEGWDVVIKPSFESAQLEPSREESQPPAKTDEARSLAEATTVIPAPSAATGTATGTTNLKVEMLGSQPSGSGAPAPAKQINESSHATTMNRTDIKNQITTMRGLDPSKLSPQRFAEGMAQLANLHQEIANYVAEDAKRGWEGQQLHEEIKSVENTWSETQLAPGKRATKLNEDNSKLGQVIKAVAKTALVYKGKLGESLKAVSRTSKLLEAVVKRGEGWQQIAEQRGQQLGALQRRFKMAAEALDMFATKYKADVTELGKRVIQLEFAGKAQTPEIQKMLKEATKPKHIAAIREAIEGKVSPPAGDTKPAEGTPATTTPATAGAATTESKKPGDSSKPVAESQEKKPEAVVSEGMTVLSPKPSDPRFLNESVEMVRRLAKASAN